MKVAFLFQQDCETVSKGVGGLLVHVFRHLAPCVPSLVLCAGRGVGERDGIPYIGIGDLPKVSFKGSLLKRLFFIKFMRNLYSAGARARFALRENVEFIVRELGVDVVIPIYSEIPEIKYFAFKGNYKILTELLIDSVSYRFLQLSVLEKLLILTLMRMYAFSDKGSAFFGVSKRDLELWFRGLKKARPVYLGLPKGFEASPKTLKSGNKVSFYHASVFMTKRDYHHIILASKLLKDRGYKNFEVNLRITVKEELERIKNSLEGLVKALGVEDVVNLDVSDKPLPLEDYLEFHIKNDVLLWTGKLQGYGITPIEALYFGNPTIVTEKAGVAEVLRDIKGVKVYNPDDVNSLVNAMEWYLRDKGWKELGSSYRAFVEEFSKMTCKMFVSLLKSLAR